MRAMLGLGAQVFVRRGELIVRVVTPIPVGYHGFVLHPDDPKDPYVFRIDLSELGIGSGRVVFSHAATGNTRLSLDLFPISLQRRATRGRRWLAAGGVVTAAIAAGAIQRRRARSALGSRSGRHRE